MESNVFKLSNAGGMSSRTRYWSMLAGNTTWVPFTPTGSFESIATVTVGSGGSAYAEFTSIPSTYTHLQVRATMKSAGSSTDFIYCRVNGDTTGGDYAVHRVQGDGSTAAAYAYSGAGIDTMWLGWSPGTSNANMVGVAVLDILDYTSTSKYKVTRGLWGYDTNGAGSVSLYSGLWLSTSAITSLKFFSNVPTNLGQYTQIALYGVK